MGKIDKIKEDIGAIKSYLGFIIAVMLTIGAGVAKLYLDGSTNILFYIGLALMFISASVFAMLSRAMHKKIKELEEL